MPQQPLAPMRMPQSLPAALLSLAYFTSRSTTAFVLAPSRSSTVTSSSPRRALLPAASHRRSTAVAAASPQQQHRSPSSTRLQGATSSCNPLGFGSRATLPRISSSARRRGGVRSLQSVAAPAGLEKGVLGGLDELLHPRNGVKERFVFFGGKGGVGKTSTAAAVAIQCADAGLSRTLVISTDPAHSLGDALDQDISGGEPVRVIGLDNLSAMEVDTDEAVKEFEEALSTFDISGMAEEMGVPKDMVESLGLAEFSQVLANPPPGIDELVALSRVLKLARSEEQNYDRIIIDTAPTGHTLRLLGFPDFLDNFLEKVIQLRGRMGGILNLLNGMFGGGGGGIVEKADVAVEKLQGYKERMVELRDLFKNQDATEFCIVTIPTQLAIAESKRLLEALNTQGIAVRNIVVNQIVSPDSSPEYVARLHKGQSACIKRLQKLADGTGDGTLDVSPVPFFDMEVAGVYPLRYLGTAAYGGANVDNWKQLATDPEQRFIILGGKGGVGKTTSSSALGVKMADEGYKTVIVSTDPAHSLGDALQMELKGGGLTPVPGIVGTGSLHALEVDTEGAVDEFKEVVDGFMRKVKSKSETGDATAGLVDQLNLGEFAGVLDNAPPGTDELVALSKVLRLVKGDNELGIKFDRVIIDTAPTGHTLRMLSYPEFLDGFFEKLIKIRNKLKGATAMLSMFSGRGGGTSAEEEKEFEEDRDRLRDFQFKMMELQELFRDESRTEFVVVTIPSMLAVAETERLVAQLRAQEVPVKHVVVNKVVEESVQEGYVQRLSKGQAAGVDQLEQVAKGAAGVSLTKVPYFDVEVRNVYGLRFMAQTLFARKDA
ncbi:unnamed protein product [Scytosiphon promiscuus]